MKRQLLQNYILKRKYISNFTKSIRKDILKVTNIKCIKTPIPQSTAIDWGVFLVLTMSSYFLLRCSSQNLNNVTLHSTIIGAIIKTNIKYIITPPSVESIAGSKTTSIV